MKLVEERDRITLVESGKLQAILGLVFLAVGIAGIAFFLMFSKGGSMVGPIVMLVFAVVGGMLFFMAKSSETVVDRNNVTVYTKKLLTGKGTQNAVPVGQVDYVYLFSESEMGMTTTSGERSRNHKSTIVLVLKDNSEMPIASELHSITVNGFNLGAITKPPLQKRLS